MINQMTV